MTDKLSAGFDLSSLKILPQDAQYKGLSFWPWSVSNLLLQVLSLRLWRLIWRSLSRVSIPGQPRCGANCGGNSCTPWSNKQKARRRAQVKRATFFGGPFGVLTRDSSVTCAWLLRCFSDLCPLVLITKMGEQMELATCSDWVSCVLAGSFHNEVLRMSIRPQ